MLDTALKSGFITDLIVPPPGTCNLSTPQLHQISHQTALSILHDFEAFIRSSPLVTHVTEIHPDHPKYIDVPSMCAEFRLDPGRKQSDGSETGEWVQYEITDTLPVLFTSTTLVYYTAMRRTASGFESVTNPGNGVRIHGTFSIVKSAETPGVESGGEGGAGGQGEGVGAEVINFVEHNETRCNWMLSKYIKATTGSAHREMHERFKGRWNEEMKRRLKQG